MNKKYFDVKKRRMPFVFNQCPRFIDKIFMQHEEKNVLSS